VNHLIVVFIIGFLILIHELGHFLAARAVGLPISTFSIGFGPKLWGFKKGETEFRFSWIPIGGYVLLGVEDEKEFFALPVKKRLVFSIGGPLANFIFAFFGFMLVMLLKSSADWQLPWTALTQTFAYTGKILNAIPMIFSQPGQLSGVVGIVSQGAVFVEANIIKTLMFSIMISLNLMVFNLLPIPGLDGGKIMMTGLEKIHPKLLKLQIPLTIAGLVFILGLMIYATILDVGRLLS